MSRRVKLTVAYLGTPFHGWQRQVEQRTVQGELETALAGLTGGRRIAVTGAGRTDAGVHARGQVAHLQLPGRFPVEKLVEALNRCLPEEIRVRSAVAAEEQFHARHDARGKHYAYRVGWGPEPLPWRGLRRAQGEAIADPQALEAAMALLVGCRDMASFTVPDPSQGPTTRELFAAWPVLSIAGVTLHFVGGGFLRYQVRRMAGLVLEIGRGRQPLEELVCLIEQPTPGAPVKTAPARGLTLEKVYYRRPPGAPGR